MSDYKEIWETLSQVDVSEYVEEKMNLSYLSWSRASVSYTHLTLPTIYSV